MAFLSPFGYDIFISYARVDDMPWPGNDTGWVTHFKAYLNTALTKQFGRDGIVAVWHDVDQVGGGMHFDEAIQEGVERSAIFLALLSNGYLAEQCFCTKELEWFHRKAESDPYGLKIGHRDRAFNVRLQNVPREQWPETLAGREGFKFHDDEEVSNPLPPGPLFDKQFAKLFSELVITLRAFKPLVEQKRTEAQAGAAPAGSQTVFVSHAEGLLRTHRRRAIEELARAGVNVIANVPPPHDLEGHAAKAAEEISRADLSVHLLEEAPGTEIDGAPDKFYSHEQVEIGKRHAKSQLIWVPKTLNVAEVADEAHRDFLADLEEQAGASRYKLVGEAPTRIASEVLAQLELLKRAVRADDAAYPDQPVALLSVHSDDSPVVMEISPVFIEKRVELRIAPEGDGPRKNVARFEESLKQASVLIIVFGRVAADWVGERLVSVQQFLVKEECPLRLCGVYTPPVDGAGAERRFDGGPRAGPLQVARIKNPDQLRTLLTVFEI